MQKVQGFTEEGNITLTVSGISGMITQKVQGSFPGATITIFLNSPAAAVAISSITRSSNIVTVTVPTNSNFIAGEPVTIAGVTDSSFNGTFTILTVGASTFTYGQTDSDTTSSGGTAQSNLRLANIYSDNAATPTPKANPFTSPADGTWFFYALNGNYDVLFSSAGIATPFTLRDFWIFEETPLLFDVTAAPFLAPGDGTNSDTPAVRAAITAAKAVRGAIIYFPGGAGGRKYILNDISLNDCNGMTFRGDGASFYDANPTSFSTVLEFDPAGASTDIFNFSANAMHIEFEQMTIQGPTTDYLNLTGIGIHFLDPTQANNLNISFRHVVFAYLNYGIEIGSTAASLTNQYLWHTYDHCSWWSCNRAIYNHAPNVQFMRFTDVQFSNCWEYDIYGTSGIELYLENVYFGIMGPNAVAAMFGPMVMTVNKIWSEITRGSVYNGSGFIPGATAIPLIVNTSGAANPDFASTLTKIYHPRRGDSSGYSIYWDGGPLTIDGGSIGGLVRWDSRRPWNRVMINNVSWNPCLTDEIVQTVGSSVSFPFMIGDYSNATAADFYIEIVDPTHFRWRKTLIGAWSASTLINFHVAIQENLIACFPPGVTWTMGDQWKLPCSITGLVNFAGTRPEAFIGVKAFRNSDVSLTNGVLTTIVHDAVSPDFQDIYGSYNSTTGEWTTMFHGRYRISCAASITTTLLAAGVPVDFILFIYLNGSELFNYVVRYSGNAIGVGELISNQVIYNYYLNQGDKITFVAKQTNPSATTLPLNGSGNSSDMYIGRMTDIANVIQ